MRLLLPAKVNYIIKTLEQKGFEAYAVGGCVRDSILAKEPKDWDITTSALPGDIKRCFRRTVDTGIKHGTVTVLLDDEHFEVTTYRVDGNYSDGRHPDSVSFTASLEEDLKRRDFTINAMAYNDRKGLVDLFDGMKDLQTKRICCVGIPEERFSEDALRIMRAVRFAAQLDFGIEEKTLRAVGSFAPSLEKVSAERIRDELGKLLCSGHPERFLLLMKTGITKVILPEFDAYADAAGGSFEANEAVAGTMRSLREVPANESLRLVMLLHDIGIANARKENGTGSLAGRAELGAETADKILRRLKYDNATRIRVVKLIRAGGSFPAPDPASVRRAMSVIGPELFEDHILTRKAYLTARGGDPADRERAEAVSRIARKIEADKDPLAIGDLAISGSDLLAEGISGRDVGECLRRALDIVLEDPGKNTKDALLGMVLSRS